MRQWVGLHIPKSEGEKQTRTPIERFAKFGGVQQSHNQHLYPRVPGYLSYIESDFHPIILDPATTELV